jgi:hypothetical protein
MEGSGKLHALGCLISTDEAPHQYPLNMRLGGPRAGLDALKKRKKLLTLSGTEPVSSL